MEIIDEQKGRYNQEVSTADWFLTILITAIPIVGFVMLFVWAFGSNTRPSKANWAKATLLWLLVGIVIYGFIAAIFGFAILSSLVD